MKIRFEWEALDTNTLRAMVTGGWLVRYHSHSGAIAMSMVPDPKHLWKVEVPTDRAEQYSERLISLERKLKDPYLDPGVKAEMEVEIEILTRLLSQHQQE